jgi:predicted NAD/FAD-dependent oxidoreductase
MMLREQKHRLKRRLKNLDVFTTQKKPKWLMIHKWLYPMPEKAATTFATVQPYSRRMSA